MQQENEDQKNRELFLATYPTENEHKYYEGTKEQVLKAIEITIEELLEKSPDGEKTVCIKANPYIIIQRVTDYPSVQK